MNTISYTSEERETHITSSDDGRLWKVYTLMPTIISKLKKVGAVPYKIDPDGAHHYRDLEFNQVSFRSGKKRVMSEENRIKASERAKKNFHNK